MPERRHVRLFRNGRNQVVRIPVEFELPGDELRESPHRFARCGIRGSRAYFWLLNSAFAYVAKGGWLR
jgi:hypothetical protein